MIGLIVLLIVFTIWFVILKWLVRKISSHLPDRPWRKFAQVAIFVALIPLPLVDEIVGGRQFARLCEANVVHVNKDTARGKTVYSDIHAPTSQVPWTWVKVWKHATLYRDVTTDEVVLSFDYLSAQGGHLFPGFDSGPDPLTFKGTCKPPGAGDKRFYEELGLTIVDKRS